MFINEVGLYVKRYKLKVFSVVVLMFVESLDFKICLDRIIFFYNCSIRSIVLRVFFKRFVFFLL